MMDGRRPAGIMSGGGGQNIARYLFNVLVPLNARQYLDSAFGSAKPLTEEHLAPSDLAELRSAVARADSSEKNTPIPGSSPSPRKRLGYEDYSTQVTGLDWHNMPASEVIGMSFSDPAARAALTLGRASYLTDKNGNVIVRDKYDIGKDTRVRSLPPENAEQWLKQAISAYENYGFMAMLRQIAVNQGLSPSYSDAPESRPLARINLGNRRDW